ncbi:MULTISPECIES: STAS domain-containing protein [unclassified Streptomyces]|uniref:STAS domain-containing protein n=1 Tax=unclassified Streptomyces TaxID=2593676 RepID=UPI00109C1E08|nr:MULTISPECIES: STAS domain-containing protein [unclassified Streptomyces]MCE3033771.1 STAS domain-containing protein [Streptomyces sp. CMSTAAHL-2]
MDTEEPPVLVLPEAVGRDGIPALCAAVRSAPERTGDGARVVVCDTDALGAPDLAQVDLPARLELTARRSGGRIRLRAPAPALRALLAAVGLRFQTERQPEEGEPARGVEEAVETGDPAR